MSRLLLGFTGTSAVSEPSLHPSLVAAYRLRVVALGALVTAAMLVNFLVYVAIDRSGEISGAGFAAVMIIGTVVLGAVVLLPWNRILVSRWALRALYGWSALTLFIAALAVYADGGGTSVMFALYPTLTVFFAIAYPQRAQTALFAIAVASYSVAIAAHGWNIAAGDFYLRIASLLIVAYVASVMSGWLVTEMRDRVQSTSDADERKDMLDTVARAARRIGSLDSAHVLGSALTGAIELGCLEAEAWLSQDGRIQLQRRISVDSRTFDQDTVEQLFRQAATKPTQVVRTHAGKAVATALYCDNALVGLLVARVVEKDGDDSLLTECIELLAAQVSAGLDVAQNVAERRDLEERLAHWAFHDSLTDLPNRVLFADRLEIALARAARDSSELAVLFLDLDGFKRINDTHGHAMGDEMLKVVSARIQTCLRPQDTLARQGGDEFIVLVEQIDGSDAATAVAQRILDALEEPITVSDNVLTVRTSIGVALTKSHPGADGDVVRRADMAMYAAKKHGGSNYVLSDQEDE